MKKIVLILVALAGFCNVNASDAADKYATFSQEIYAFLIEEGYTPQYGKNNSISFKHEGDNFWINFDERNVNPYYLSMGVSYVYSDDFSKEAIQKYLPEILMYKGLYINFYNSTYEYCAEILFMTTDAFKFSFYRYLEVITEGKKELRKLISQN